MGELLSVQGVPEGVLWADCVKLSRVSTLPPHFWDFCAKFRFHLAVEKAGVTAL